MTGTKRIRWEDALDGSSFGYAGTIGPALFKIYAPEDPAGEWPLVSGLPGQEDWRWPGAGPGVLKGKAEEWLSGFAASLGAVFPIPDCFRCGDPITGKPVRAGYDPAGRVFCSDECMDAEDEAASGAMR